MIIHILFTCDSHKSNSSRVLRGVFTDYGLLEEAQATLRKNEIVDKLKNDEFEEYFDIVSIEENEFQANGGYY